MTLILFVFINFVLLLSIRGLLIIYKYFYKGNFVVDHLRIQNIPLYLFSPILSLFLIGNFSIIANFFVPIKELKIFLIFLLILLTLVNTKEKILIQEKLFFTVSVIIVPLVLAVSSYGLKLHYDSVDYHINFQNWIRESKIIFGLSNLYIAYGWSTIYEYILSIFWIGNSFMGLHYVNLIFFVLFYNFLSYNLFYSQNTFLKYLSGNVILYSFFDNFGINGGGNGFLSIQMVGKPDLAVGVLYFISFSLFLSDFLKKKFSFNNLIFIAIISLFAFQIKIVSSFLIVPILIYFFNLKRIKLNFSQILITFTLILFFISFLIKNVIISGCIFFPIEQTCLTNLYWTDKSIVETFSNNVIRDNNGIFFSEDIKVWFSTWVNTAFNLQVFSNMLISFILIGLINLVLMKKADCFNLKNKFYSQMMIFLILLIFLISGPTVRYGYGTFLILLSSITIWKQLPKDNLDLKKYKLIMGLILFFSIALTPRLYSYKDFLDSPFSVTDVENSTEEYLNLGSLSRLELLIADDTICYIPKTCVRYSKGTYPKLSYIKNYKVYALTEK